MQAQYTWSEHKVIGSGTCGKVVAGARRVDGRNYALKHVDTTCAEWQLEYQLLSGMGHPNVVRAVDMFEPHARRPTTGVIVTDLYDMDLSTFLQRRSGIVTQKAAWEISRQLATGLAHVHKTGVIHRDIKPQNVLVSFDMDEGIVRVVLADFGLARWMPGRREVGEEAASAKDILALSQGQGELMTRNVVTVWYRAPEIMLADKTAPRVQYTSAIDVWSLGCVVYELLKGEPLARAADEEGVLRKIVKAIGPCPSPLKASFGERLLLAEQKADALSQGHVVRDAAASEAGVCVNKMLQWKPSDRPSCEELLQEAWMQVRGGRGSQASP